MRYGACLVVLSWMVGGVAAFADDKSSAAFDSLDFQPEYVFTTSMMNGGKRMAIKPNEYCRPFAFKPDFLQKRCKPHRNSFICQGETESFLISVYASKEECDKYLSYARKQLD
jgi:hypothetical protein